MKTFSQFLNEQKGDPVNKQTFKIRPFKVKLFGKMMTVYRVFDEKNEVVQVGSTEAEAEAWVTQNGALIEAYEDGEIDGILDSVIDKMSCDDEDGDEMNESKIAVNIRTALKMFFDAGWDDEEKLQKAHSIITNIKQASKGFWYADDISDAIKKNKKG